MNNSSRGNRRTLRRKLYCPVHPEQHNEGNGKEYFLQLLAAQHLYLRGINPREAQLVIEAYPSADAQR